MTFQRFLVIDRAATRIQNFSWGPTPCQKSPLPPFIKGGLGGISEAVGPKTISWQFSRFFILTGHATNHVLIDQSLKVGNSGSKTFCGIYSLFFLN
jgi:hypothetical protein